MKRQRLLAIGAVTLTSILWGTTGTAATFAPDAGPLAIGAAALTPQRSWRILDSSAASFKVKASSSSTSFCSFSDMIRLSPRAFQKIVVVCFTASGCQSSRIKQPLLLLPFLNVRAEL